jgi:hypothetical protein
MHSAIRGLSGSGWYGVLIGFLLLGVGFGVFLSTNRMRFSNVLSLLETFFPGARRRHEMTEAMGPRPHLMRERTVSYPAVFCLRATTP